MAETRECVTPWLRPARGWPAHVPGQYMRVGVDVDGVRHWRTYSLTSLPGRSDGRIAITVKRTPDGLVSGHLVRHARRGVLVRLAPPAGNCFRPVSAAADAGGEGGRVRFLVSGKKADADGTTPLLVAGERAGALLPHGCRTGICNSCVGRRRSGAVRDLRTGDRQRAEGQMVRTCVNAAAGSVEIDL